MPLFWSAAERGLYLIRASRRKASQAGMRQPYNMVPREDGLLEMLGKRAALAVIILVFLNGMGCRRADTVTTDRVAVRPSAEAIAEADRYYAQRADLVKVRQAIV